jgi:hypothetical protein
MKKANCVWIVETKWDGFHWTPYDWGLTKKDAQKSLSECLNQGDVDLYRIRKYIAEEPK